MDLWISQELIRFLRNRLGVARDPDERRKLLTMLAEEQARLENLISASTSPTDTPFATSANGSNGRAFDQRR